MGGADPGDFEVTSTCENTTLAETTSCQISALFLPGARGNRSATITFVGAGTTYTITLQGTGFTTPAVASLSPSTGSELGGTTVTITGTNLGDVTSVLFGSTAAVFTIDSDTQITATAPVHAAGAVTITVAVTVPWKFRFDRIVAPLAS